jgi:uncharacterized coiled-coil protein SlyX
MPLGLENRIKELCAKALELPDSSPELNEVIKELQTVLRQHIEGLRKMVANGLASPLDGRPSKQD